jgi:hypothetical protein
VNNWYDHTTLYILCLVCVAASTSVSPALKLKPSSPQFRPVSSLTFSMSSIKDSLAAEAVQDRVNELLLSSGITYKEYVLGFAFAVYGLETYLRLDYTYNDKDPVNHTCKPSFTI